MVFKRRRHCIVHDDTATDRPRGFGIVTRTKLQQRGVCGRRPLFVNKCKKTCQFKTWCKGEKSNIKNSTDHFCEDTRQNALAALTNLGHVTPFLLLGPPHNLTIQWVREITSLDSKLPDQTEVQIRTDLRSNTLAQRNRSQSSSSSSFYLLENNTANKYK